MRVAILSSEAVPFAKTGGLADVAGALPKALNENGQDALLVLPLFEQIKRGHLRELIIDNLDVDWRGRQYRARVWYSEAAGAPSFLIDAPEYFARNSIYGFQDDHLRFAFFCRASLALLRRLGAPPDVVHVNDWPGGFASAELSARRRYDSFYSRTRTIFSIHNLAYQGAFDPGDLWILGFGPEERDAFMMEGAASALKAGLMTADALSTVSPRYSREIQTHEHGHGLDWLLRMRSDRFVGITNGVDYEVWNPATDPHLPAHYDADNLAGKRACKLALLREFMLPEDLDRPIIANISRLTSQKGYDLIKEAAGAILNAGAFFIALGSGATEYEDFLQGLRDYAPRRVGIYKGFNESLAHRIEAGADIFLMPSLFEPCGLNQMYSLRYGTVPIVRATGGLDDTVEDFDRVRGTGTGFKFGPYTAGAMLDKIYEALYCYAEPDIWLRLQSNGMRADNSWQVAARKYVQLYSAVTQL
ncbi:MAG TPA: glycogen/starch synthase [Pyrinomonadaceae bacterium]|nr:glycogen/starch synthase [Pyrinomonadaceae bacterium]